MTKTEMLYTVLFVIVALVAYDYLIKPVVGKFVPAPAPTAATK